MTNSKRHIQRKVNKAIKLSCKRSRAIRFAIEQDNKLKSTAQIVRG